MAKILIIETATDICSVAIGDSGQLLASKSIVQPNSHSEQLSLLIQSCMEMAAITFAQLQAVAVSIGPGSYTSLRVGLSTAKGIAYALDIPIIALDTHQGLAAGIMTDMRQNTILPTHQNFYLVSMIDARRMEVALAVFDPQFNKIVENGQHIIDNNLFYNLSDLGQINNKNPMFILAGNGSEKISSGMLSENIVQSSVKNCDARHFLEISYNKYQLSDFQSVAYLEPQYMKLPNVTAKKNV